jgi:hypothetical protein
MMNNKDAVSISREDKKSLHKRYLLWLYKMTRDELERIERKFTQLDVDRQIEAFLSKKNGISVLLEEWKSYILAKESDALKLKFSSDGRLDPKYRFLMLKLEVISQIIVKMFGRRTFNEFKRLYEERALRMILEDTSGRR